MDMMWRNIQSDWIYIGLASVILLLGLKGFLFRYDWKRQRKKFLNEFNVSEEKVNEIFRPASDRLYKFLSAVIMLSAIFGSSAYIYLSVFGESAVFGDVISVILAFSLISFLVFTGALLAFKNHTMRAVMRLRNLDYFRPGSSWRKRLIGDPMSNRPLVNGYARLRGLVWFLVGLFLAYQVLRHAFPALPALL